MSDQGHDQPSTRRPGRYTETNHGRRWYATGGIDKRSGGAVGPIKPLGWQAPWLPDPTFFRFNPDEPNMLTIDYQGMLDSRLAAHAAWNAEFRSMALKRGWDPSDPEKLNSLVELVGPKPLPVEPIIAAMQGNPWILGLSQKVDPRVERFLPKKQSRVATALDSFDFRPVEEPDAETDEHFDDRMDLEEQHDRDAIGGKMQKLPKKPKAKAAA
jgi:hypothetical protein